MSQLQLYKYFLDYDVNDDNNHVVSIDGKEILIPLTNNPVEEYELRFLLDFLYWLAEDAKTHFVDADRVSLFHLTKVMIKMKYPVYVHKLTDVHRIDKINEIYITKANHKIFFGAMLGVKVVRGCFIYPFSIMGGKHDSR